VSEKKKYHENFQFAERKSVFNVFDRGDIKVTKSWMREASQTFNMQREKGFLFKRG